MLLCGAGSMQAQQYMRIWQGEDSKRIALENAGAMTVNGQTLTIGGTPYDMNAIDSISIVKTTYIQWNGNGANVNIPDAAKKYVNVSVTDGNVVITNTNVTEEMEFVLSGESSNGSLTYNGAYKCKFHLNGVKLTSKTGAAIDIQCGKRIDLILADGTQNTLTDAANGNQKAALYCKGHMEIDGNGSLTVSGNSKHGIATKEYLILKKGCGTIDIANAASDAMHVGQYFQMNGGTVTINENTAADGIQVDATSDATDANNGQVMIKGGTIQATIAHEDCKGIKTSGAEEGQAGGDISITGGNITIMASGNGSRGIQTDANILIGSTDEPTKILITAAGGLCTQPECSEDPHRCMGIKVDGNLTVTGGTTTVYNTGKKSRGIKIGGTYVNKGGTVEAAIVY